MNTIPLPNGRYIDPDNETPVQLSVIEAVAQMLNMPGICFREPNPKGYSGTPVPKSRVRALLDKATAGCPTALATLRRIANIPR